MFKKLALAVLLAGLAFGCGKPEANSANTSNRNTRVADGKIEVKDRVLISSGVSKSMFMEGEVVSHDGSRAKVGVIQRNANGFYTTGSQFEDVEFSELYEVPGDGTKQEVKAGEIVLAKGTMQPSDLLAWYGAEVVKIDNLGVVVKGLGENKQPWTVGQDELVKPSDTTIAGFKQSGEKSTLLSAAMKHRPVRVEGYQPKVGDRVLAERQMAGFWEPGMISRMEEVRMGGSIVYVKWSDPSIVGAGKVYTILPLENAAKLSAPEVGSYILVQPPSAGRWLYAEVIAVSGSAVEVRLEDGTTRTVNPGEYWLLQENAP